MSRFIWIDSKELYDQHFGMQTNIIGDEYSGYSESDEGLIFDTETGSVVLDFGCNEEYYPTCGVKPNEEYLAVIIDALNNYKKSKAE